MSQQSPQSLVERVRPLEPSFFQNQDEIFERLRSDSPVFWHDEYQLWLISTYDEVKTVFRSSNEYSVAFGLMVGDNKQALSMFPEGSIDLTGCPMPHAAEARRAARKARDGNGAESLIGLDPPRHSQVRRIISKAFTPRVVAGLESRIRELTVASLQTMPTNEPVDLVQLLSVPVPLYTIAELLGIPKEDHDAFKRWSDAIFMYANELTEETRAYVGGQLAECYGYFADFLADRVANPRDDLLSTLVHAEIEGEGLSDATLQSLGLQLLAAGNETTRNLISGGAMALAAHPDQRAMLAADPTLMQRAIEECLRWVSPITHFARTAKVDTHLGGTPIAKGDYVVMLIGSANRDDKAWEHASTFDITRPPEPMHLALGYGPHVCLGASLARLEASVVFDELLRHYPNFEIVGEPVPTASTMINGLDHLYVQLA